MEKKKSEKETGIRGTMMAFVKERGRLGLNAMLEEELLMGRDYKH